jgi:hypothetical protein
MLLESTFRPNFQISSRTAHNIFHRYNFGKKKVKINYTSIIKKGIFLNKFSLILQITKIRFMYFDFNTMTYENELPHNLSISLISSQFRTLLVQPTIVGNCNTICV